MLKNDEINYDKFTAQADLKNVKPIPEFILGNQANTYKKQYRVTI
jgi:hypothetical protein